MLITTILSSLGLSVLADEQDDEKEEYYTIFEWNDGMKMERALTAFTYRTVLRCGDYVFYIEAYRNFLDTMNLQDSLRKDKKLIGQRLAWLTVIYLHCEYESTFCYSGPGRFGIPRFEPKPFIKFAEKGAPDSVDPYELAIYQTGQMDKSLFMLSQEDFLKTIGRS